MSAPRIETMCVSVDTYTASVGPAATPSLRMSHPAFASRATFSAMKFAIAPPDVSAPPAVEGNPNTSCANQRANPSSISVAAGARRHPPAFPLSPDASRSAAAPGTVPAPEM